MARNYSSNNGNGGCLIWVLVIVWFIGNAALFTGSFDDLPLLCVLAIIGDIAAIIAVINAIANKSQKNAASKSSSSTATIMPTSTPTATTKVSSPENEDKSKLNQLRSKYRVTQTQAVSTTADPLQKGLESYQCVEVLQNVNKAINKRSEYTKVMNSLKKEIDDILSCHGCNNDRERIKHIKSNEELLQQKKEEYTTAANDMKRIQVSLLSKEKEAFRKILSAFSEINSCEKVSSESGVALTSFLKIRSKIPGDLFVSELVPAELNFGAYRFFLLPDVVLAFDKSSTFVTALEPMALIMTFRDKTKSVYMQKNGSNNTWTYSDSIIANDSTLISEGVSRTGWLYEKKNGGPDLRYSHNPMYVSRTDTYAYSDFSIQIGQYKADYSLSKGKLSDKLISMTKEYCSEMHELNAIPSLLRLIESVAKKKETANNLSEQYENVSKNIICKVC